MSQVPKTPSVVTQQPQGLPRFPQGGPSNVPGPIPQQQQMPMNQFPQQGGYQGGYPQPMYVQQPRPGPYGPQQFQQPGFGPMPMGGMPMQQNAGMGMMSPGMGGLGPVPPPSTPMAPIIGCPIGLEFLIGTEHLMVKQQIEPMEVLLAQVGISFETPNRYDILNTAGQRIYFAAEVGNLLAMQCSPSGRTRPFKITVVDFVGRQVLIIDRPWSCEFCLLSCFNFCGTSGTSINIKLGDGTFLGEVIQKCNGCQPLLEVLDGMRNLVATIQGESCGDCCCSCSGACCGDIKFTVFATDGTSIGLITKKWSGFLKEAFTDADNFGVSFPMYMDVRAKALLLGAVFLIDFMFFEENPHANNNRHRSNFL